jgi:hypothetical protein
VEDDMEELEPIPVLVKNTDDFKVSDSGTNAIECSEVALTAANNIAQILQQDPLRLYAWVECKTADVGIAHSLTQASDPTNASVTQATGPLNGFRLISGAPRLPIETQDPVWAFRIGADAFVSVLVVRKRG